MTNEPVAYLVSQEPLSLVHWLSDVKPIGVDDKQITSLYTKEQLQPKVQMTREQYNQFENYKIGKNNFYHFWQSLLVDDVSLFKIVSERDLMLSWLNPEMIEIVPEKKWFVRSKNPDKEEDYLYQCGKILSFNEVMYGKKDHAPKLAHKFDTKNEAEEWTNPLTKAVLLPVEGE